MIKKWQSLIVVVVCFLFIALLTLFFLIPKTAALVLPYRWDHIPLGEERNTVLQYLGKPENDLKALSKADVWKVKRNNGEYILTIEYKTNNSDTIASSFALAFVYKLGFLKKTYELKSKSAE